MKIEVSFSKNESLLSSIIFLIVGVVLLTNADTVLKFISVVIGSALLIVGVIKVFLYYQRKKKYESGGSLGLIAAVAFVFFGIIFIFFSNFIETSIRYIFGAWILFSGVNTFINAISLSPKNTHFISSLIVSVLLIALSLYVIFSENLLLKGIGIVMIIYSAIEIVDFIIGKREVKTYEPKEGETTLIVPNKKDTKNK